ncbi:MAG: hypothetical protein IJU41_03950 [Clostridia bacterium]|nr:hypothetical protein [Clostridia bacterium]
MKNPKCTARSVGLIVLAFGFGLLASYFLPAGWLVVVEAIILIAVGFLYFSAR